MADSRRIEIVPTEHFPSHVAGADAERLAAWGVVGQADLARTDGGRWSGSLRSAVAVLAGAQPIAWSSRSVQTASPSVGDIGSTFLRMVMIPGARLAAALGAWWRREEHDDGHLRLDAPREVGGAWSLSGTLRATPISRALPVELLLSPHRGRWTRLELMPRRAIHPNPMYFREGNRAVDRFVAAIRAHDVVAESWEPGTRKAPGTVAWAPREGPRRDGEAL